MVSRCIWSVWKRHLVKIQKNELTRYGKNFLSSSRYGIHWSNWKGLMLWSGHLLVIISYRLFIELNDKITICNNRKTYYLSCLVLENWKLYGPHFPLGIVDVRSTNVLKVTKFGFWTTYLRGRCTVMMNNKRYKAVGHNEYKQISLSRPSACNLELCNTILLDVIQWQRSTS